MIRIAPPASGSRLNAANSGGCCFDGIDMTPAAFAAAFGTIAREVSDGTGIDSAVLLAQWANETARGTVVVGNNLGHIRCSPTTFCRYASLGDFATACIATFHNGFYNAVLAAKTPEAQLAALVASPWDSNHYGGSLQSFYVPVEVYEMTPAEEPTLNRFDSILAGCPPHHKATEYGPLASTKHVTRSS